MLLHPMLYPDLMEDNKFVVELFNIPITTSNGNQYTYFDYLANHQKISWVSGLLSKKTKEHNIRYRIPISLNQRASRCGRNYSQRYITQG